MKILIAGDSWGCGEWESFKILHSGLTQYCHDAGHLVFNISKPGGSNICTYDRIHHFLQTNQHLQIQCVIVFQTEWTRDIVTEDQSTIAEDLMHGYHALKHRLMDRFYYRLSQTSTEHNIPIHIVGGCSDTIWFDQIENEHRGIRMGCHSLTNLLLEHNHRILEPAYAVFSLSASKSINYIKQHLNTKDLELLLDDIDIGHQRLDQWKKHKEFFWPDGAHPNRHGHEVLFNFLKDQGIFNEHK
jgi:hypothetical protein